VLRRILQNLFSNILIHLVRFAVVFILAPVIVRALGNYDYGVWEIVGSVVGYMGILEMGMKPAITRYVARYNALSDEENIRKVYSTSLIFMGIIGFIAFSSLIMWITLAPEIIAPKGLDGMRYVLLLLIIGAQLLITFPGYVIECIHEGFQRYTLQNNIAIVTILIGVSVLYFLLQRGYGLLTLALANAVGNSVKFTIYWILLRLPRYGQFRFRARDISWPTLKTLVKFGSKNFVQSLAGSLSNSSDPLIIGAFLGPAAVPFYIIPAKLIFHVRSLVMVMTQVFMPVFSDLDAQGEKPILHRVLTVASRYVVGISLPIIVGVCVLGGSLPVPVDGT